MNRRVFPENIAKVYVVGMILSKNDDMIASDDLTDETKLLTTLTARSDFDRKPILTNIGHSSDSMDRLKTDFEDFYRIIPSLTHSGLAISNARRDKVLQCKNPFEEGTKFHGCKDTNSVPEMYSSTSSHRSAYDDSERVKLFSGSPSDVVPFDDPGHWIELRTYSTV